MPLFGKTLFESLLERYEEEAVEAEKQAAEPDEQGVRGLNSGFVVADTGFDMPDALRFEDYYDDFGADLPQSAFSVSERIDYVTPEAVADELQLQQYSDAAALREQRRHFALGNHPDRVPPEYRRNATLRMMIANHLIDQAILRVSQI